MKGIQGHPGESVSSSYVFCTLFYAWPVLRICTMYLNSCMHACMAYNYVLRICTMYLNSCMHACMHGLYVLRIIMYNVP